MTYLAPLDELRRARETQQAHSIHLAWQAAELDGQADDRFADAGAMLVARRAWWQVPTDVYTSLAQAERLVARILVLDQRIAGLKKAPRRDRWRAVSMVPWRVSKWAASKRRARASARLRQALVTIGRAGAAAGIAVPDVEPLLEQAADVQARAEGLRAALGAASLRLSALDREIRLREQAEKQMGFDSLYFAAYFQAHGLPAIWSPLELNVGEVAYLATEAALVPMPADVLNARSDSEHDESVAYTGIRYWIGTDRNCPAPPSAFKPADNGALVVSNRRLAFVGGTESVAIPLDAVVTVDIYTDAIAVACLGRAELDLFLVKAPREVAFYLNWAMSIRMGG